MRWLAMPDGHGWECAHAVRRGPQLQGRSEGLGFQGLLLRPLLALRSTHTKKPPVSPWCGRNRMQRW
jgi:hypothetical protein